MGLYTRSPVSGCEGPLIVDRPRQHAASHRGPTRRACRGRFDSGASLWTVGMNPARHLLEAPQVSSLHRAVDGNVQEGDFAWSDVDKRTEVADIRCIEMEKGEFGKADEGTQVERRACPRGPVPQARAVRTVLKDRSLAVLAATHLLSLAARPDARKASDQLRSTPSCPVASMAPQRRRPSRWTSSVDGLVASLAQPTAPVAAEVA